MSGQISAMIADYPGILAVKDGNGLSVLAVADSQRSRFLPDVPTIGEALTLGTDIDLTNWFAVVAPKGIPESVRKVLFDAVAYAAADKDIQDKLTTAGYSSFSQKSVGALEQFIAAENAKWKSLVNKPEVQRNLQN
jgi:tripartite-type tricarboxylate transporter receptor subunit TctC